MFIQVISGKVNDARGARQAMERWQAELRPKATGYLGSTSGMADDGTFVTIVRFESEDAARANSDNPEQGAWWDQHMSKLFDGAPTFIDCPDVQVVGNGGSQDAGFVQVMFFKSKDSDAMRQLEHEFEGLVAGRPDYIGGTNAMGADGSFVHTNYFTSQKEAREGEAKGFGWVRSADLEPVPDSQIQSLFQRFGELVQDVQYVDIPDPWLDSP